MTKAVVETTCEVLAEITSIIQLLEARIPASQRSLANQRLAKRLERTLSKYFESLSKAFPYHRLDRLYTRYVKESLGSETDGFLDPLLSSFDKKLEADIAGHLTNIRVAGNAEMITWGKTNAGIPIAFEGPPLSEAVSWAETQSAQLVTQMNAESKRRIAKTISDGIKNKRGIPGLGRDIRKAFDNMSVYRGQLIARTETANALSQASLDRMKDMEIEGKEWITVGDERVSPECMGNQGEGVIPRNQTFGGGTMAPPQHPACRCAIAPAILKGKPARVNEQVSEFAGRTKTEDIEHAAGFNSQGQELLAKSGNVNSVTFTPKEVTLLRNAEVFIHNHPRSTPFSLNDLRFATHINAKKIVVTSQKYKYTATPTSGKTWDIEKIISTHTIEEKRLFPEAVKVFKQSGQDAADRWFFHNIWLNIQEKARIKYTREAM